MISIPTFDSCAEKLIKVQAKQQIFEHRLSLTTGLLGATLFNLSERVPL
jgi:hypothetical protein